MNMLVALTRTGQVQVVVNISVAPFRRAVPPGIGAEVKVIGEV